jgi:hypothetical protein
LPHFGQRRKRLRLTFLIRGRKTIANLLLVWQETFSKRGQAPAKARQ